MEEQVSIFSLESRDSDVSEQMVFLPLRTVEGKWVMSGGKLISPKGVEHFSQIKNLLIIQHGLPGDEWRLKAEDKARKVAKERADVSTLLLVPGGTRATYRLGIKGADTGDAEVDVCRETRPFFSSQPFSFERYKRMLFHALCGMRAHVDRNCRISLAGHSYGAAALLYALGRCRQDGMQPPVAASFLAPFVKIATDTDDPEITLNIFNTRDQIAEALSYGNHIGRLRDLLETLHQFYNLTEARNPIEWHSKAFGARFFEAIGDLSSLNEKCAIQVFRGEQDFYIGPEHSELIANRIGKARQAIETVLPNDAHELESLDFARLF